MALVLPLIIGGAHFAAAQTTTPEAELLATVKNHPLNKLGPWLANLSDEYQKSSNKAAFKTQTPALRVGGNRVGVDFYANDAVSLKQSLTALGATRITTRGPLISAQVPVSALSRIGVLPSLKFASPALATTRVASQGTVVSQGDRSLNSDTVRNATGLDGAGVTIGLMSDSFECNPPAFVPGAPTTTAAQDRTSQDVDPGVVVLDNGPCPGSDEGRGMAQLVKDVAPGASQQFHTAFNSLVDFADGILELQEAGSDVIVDDVIYFAENMFSDGIIAQAADEAVARGAAYFSSAGNDARLSYESAYREVIVPFGRPGNPALGVRAHDFGGGRHVAAGPGDAGRRFGGHSLQPAMGSAVPLLHYVRARDRPDGDVSATRCDRRSRPAHLRRELQAGEAVPAGHGDRHHLPDHRKPQHRR